jgi:hypothetical protein
MTTERRPHERRVEGRASPRLPHIQRVRSTALPLLAVVAIAVITTLSYDRRREAGEETRFSQVHSTLSGTVASRTTDVRLELLAGIARKERAQLGRKVEFLSGIIQEQRVSPSDAMFLALSIINECRKADYDPLFVAAVIKAESTFRSHAISNQGARGLMQILPTTGKYISKKRDIRWVGEQQLHNPDFNIRVGIQYLKYLDTMFSGNREKVLIAYNWGPGNLIDAIKNQRRIPSGPLNYAKKILKHHGSWNQLYRVELAQLETPTARLG